MLFLTFSFSLIPTATYLSVLVSPNNRIVFFIGEDHMIPIPDGYDRPIVAKLLELLKEAEADPDAGYHLLIEKSHFGYDLLGELMNHADKFKNSVLENIEVRKITKGVTAVMCEFNEWFSGYYRDTQNIPAQELQEQQQVFSERYACDIGTATFQDALDECEKLIKKALEKNSLRAQKNPRHARTAQDIRDSMEKLKVLLGKHGFQITDGFMDVSLELKKKYPYDVYSKTLKEIQESMCFMAAKAMDLVTYERIMDLCDESSSKPLVVIAGAGHTMNLENHLRLMGWQEILLISHLPMREDGKIIRYNPLTAEDFNVLHLPKEHFLALLPKKKVCSCILL